MRRVGAVLDVAAVAAYAHPALGVPMGEFLEQVGEAGHVVLVPALCGVAAIRELGGDPAAAVAVMMLFDAPCVQVVPLGQEDVSPVGEFAAREDIPTALAHAATLAREHGAWMVTTDPYRPEVERALPAGWHIERIGVDWDVDWDAPDPGE